MKIIALYQSKNEGIENNKKVLEQSKIMDDGLIILDDGSTDNSFPDEIIKDPHVLEYVKLPEKKMFEGINMSVLLNLAHKHEADWCYLPGGHYRYIGKIEDFKKIITNLDLFGVTHVNLRWFTMWNKTQYRNDKNYNPENRSFCDIWKLQKNTWFKIKEAHCTHPENSKEYHTLLNSIASVTYGRNNEKNRLDKYNLYSKMEGMNETFEHYLDKEVSLKDYNEESMMNDIVEWNKTRPRFWIRWNGLTYIDQRIIERMMKK